MKSRSRHLPGRRVGMTLMREVTSADVAGEEKTVFGTGRFEDEASVWEAYGLPVPPMKLDQQVCGCCAVANKRGGPVSAVP